MGVRMRDFAMPSTIVWDDKTYDLNYGKFVAEPFERGFGVTVGNSLRRILLSSIEGSAVTAVKIKGVDHEFSTISGVFEDVAQVVLNIKGLVLRSHSRSPKTISLQCDKKGEYKAKDIISNENVEIINSDHHMLTLTDNIKVNIEMEVGRGRGWVSAEKNKREDMAIGVIPIDSLFSPIVKMNFKVENTRVGAITDYEKIIMEVWTNGSVEPKEALVYASYILQKHFDVFTQLGEVVEEEEEVISEEMDDSLVEKVKMSISELELSVRSANCIKDAGINSIGELVQLTEQELLQHRNFGKKSLNELVAILKDMGLSFGMEFSEDVKKKLQEEAIKK
ncbi:MAG: DNA-directed RNA polymerase subunit alpha [Candidatus Saelkia tenebricola]|nr:DNA-directed RNA polymerase subunit alpha [Candidatus Saelkia tenebricola]